MNTAVDHTEKHVDTLLRANQFTREIRAFISNQAQTFCTQLSSTVGDFLYQNLDDRDHSEHEVKAFDQYKWCFFSGHATKSGLHENWSQSCLTSALIS